MNKVKTKIGDALVQVIAVMIGLILIFPIVYCVCSAFKTPVNLLCQSFCLKALPILRTLKTRCIRRH